MSNALYWRERMCAAPRLKLEDGLAYIELGDRPVLFPSEADARFFFAAYRDVPNLASQTDTLRRWIDEGALHEAEARAQAAEEALGRIRRENDELRVQLAAQAEVAAKAISRARLLAFALKRKAAP